MVLELASVGALSAPDDAVREALLPAPAFAPPVGVPVTFRRLRGSAAARGRMAPGLLTVLPDGDARIVAPPTVRVLPAWGDPVEIVFAYAEATRADGREGQAVEGRLVRLEVDGAAVVLRIGPAPGPPERWARLVVGGDGAGR